MSEWRRFVALIYDLTGAKEEGEEFPLARSRCLSALSVPLKKLTLARLLRPNGGGDGDANSGGGNSTRLNSTLPQTWPVSRPDPACRQFARSNPSSHSTFQASLNILAPDLPLARSLARPPARSIDVKARARALRLHADARALCGGPIVPPPPPPPRLCFHFTVFQLCDSCCCCCCFRCCRRCSKLLSRSEKEKKKKRKAPNGRALGAGAPLRHREFGRRALKRKRAAERSCGWAS